MKTPKSGSLVLRLNVRFERPKNGPRRAYKYAAAGCAPPPSLATCQRRASCLEGLATTKTSLHHNRVNAFLHGAMQWFKNFEDERRLNASPVMIAASLHQMAEKDDPQVTPEALCLPEAVHAGFREKLFLYREANVLLALMDRVSPSSDVRDPLFELVFGEYERIIFRELSDHFGELSDHPILRAARRQSVMAALQDLKVRIHPPMGNKFDIARDWSRNWFAGMSRRDESRET